MSASLISYNKVSFKTAKPTDLKIIFFAFSECLAFLFDILYFECAHRHGWDTIFAGTGCPKMCLRINWSVKTLGNRPSIGFARSCLWAPGPVYHEDECDLSVLYWKPIGKYYNLKHSCKAVLKKVLWSFFYFYFLASFFRNRSPSIFLRRGMCYL